MPTLSSPNRIVLKYFQSLRRVVVESKKAESDEHRRQSAALAVVMSVTVVEDVQMQSVAVFLGIRLRDSFFGRLQ